MQYLAGWADSRAIRPAWFPPSCRATVTDTGLCDFRTLRVTIRYNILMDPFESRILSSLDITAGTFRRSRDEPGLHSGKTYLAAISGGADSTAMLAALAELRKEAGFSLYCVHVEHGIRPAEESQGDARAVESLCKNLEVPCRVIAVPRGRVAAAARLNKSGIEAAARFFRMRALHREARRIGADKILVAHTRDDLLETVLMGILRGSGPAGLSAMRRERGKILRPLLDLTREDVINYLSGRGLAFCTDSSNADIRFLRNRVRHKLVPCLDTYFPSWRTSLLNLAETQARTAAFISDEAQKRLPWNFSERELWVSTDKFLAEPSIIREEAVFLASDTICKDTFSQRGALFPRRTSLRAFLEGLEKGIVKSGDLGPIRLEKQNNEIRIKKARIANTEQGFSMLIDKAGLYKLKGKFSIKAELNNSVESPELPEKNVFFARLPLVLRSLGQRDFIVKAGQKRRLSDILKGQFLSDQAGFVTAEDGEGIAAFIHGGGEKDPLIFSRDNFQKANDTGGDARLVRASADLSGPGTYCRFSVFKPFSGGTDARRSK